MPIARLPSSTNEVPAPFQDNIDLHYTGKAPSSCRCQAGKERLTNKEKCLYPTIITNKHHRLKSASTPSLSLIRLHAHICTMLNTNHDRAEIYEKT